jgi:hypothetical protein
MKKERPILFTGEMVRAILEGRKTQTRRLVYTNGYVPTIDISKVRNFTKECRHGQPGDVLWVKETFYDSRKESKRMPVTYRADISVDEDLSRDFAWKPSIFMPRWASRITLEITNVRVERLQEITEADAKAEGTAWPELLTSGKSHGYRQGYRNLWESISGKGSWAQNSFCWVLEFRRIKPA